MFCEQKVVCNVLCLIVLLGFHQQIPRVAIQRCVSAERNGRVGKTNNSESPRVNNNLRLCVSKVRY